MRILDLGGVLGLLVVHGGIGLAASTELVVAEGLLAILVGVALVVRDSSQASS